ncbi:uncharacterized protein K452DRAFT_292359 [Aplosporella prunicola CBS 121167]|uniref:Uncharacterized protein n=1 Tax=Aplosporella prunicola CBS 121167 TaxID=1176127 RepID=A0A6A6AX50_9PEZI|nr:uncharacterized protein K452DRAFT_292359 [Aplosporella prunicola CBS 121167]KAF2136509.1 hypothetical protein K452DRAFT_292359 [Aplosporella prunicola CBS 121167]
MVSPPTHPRSRYSYPTAVGTRGANAVSAPSPAGPPRNESAGPSLRNPSFASPQIVPR